MQFGEGQLAAVSQGGSILNAAVASHAIPSMDEPESADGRSGLASPNSGPVFFFHILNTGGTSLSAALTRMYSASDVVPTHGDLITIDFLRSLGPRLLQPILIRGQVEHNVLSYMLRRSRTITLLRDPRSHAVSHYLHHLRETTWPTCRAAKELGFKGFHLRYWQYNLFQTFCLYCSIAEAPTCRPSDLEKGVGPVLDLLENMTFVGYLEDVDSIDEFLPAILNLPRPLNFPHLNTAANFGVAPDAVARLHEEYDELTRHPKVSYLLAIERTIYNKVLSLRTKWPRIAADNAILRHGAKTHIALRNSDGAIYLASNWRASNSRAGVTLWWTGDDERSTFVVERRRHIRAVSFEIYEMHTVPRLVVEAFGRPVEHRSAVGPDGRSVITIDLGPPKPDGLNPERVLLALRIARSVGQLSPPFFSTLAVGGFQLLPEAVFAGSPSPDPGLSGVN